MTEHVPVPDPHSRFEDEGIPDLQDGTPEQQWAVDPQEAPLPADHPVAVDDFGTTVEEQIEGEPLGARLGREEPEAEPVFGAGGPNDPGESVRAPGEPAEGTAADLEGTAGPGAAEAGSGGVDPRTGEPILSEDSGLGVGSDLDTGFQPDADVDSPSPAHPEEPSGLVWDEPRPAGRLVAPDEGAHPDAEPDEVAREVGPDFGGYTAEEAAMRVEPE
jgi:hypothetical protein